MPGNVAHHLAAARRMPHVHRVPQIQRLRQRRQVIGIRVHIVAAPRLARPTMPPPVVCNRAVSVLRQKHHLVLERIRAQRPPMAEHHRLPRAPILVVNLGPILRSNRWHALNLLELRLIQMLSHWKSPNCHRSSVPSLCNFLLSQRRDTSNPSRQLLRNPIHHQNRVPQVWIFRPGIPRTLPRRLFGTPNPTLAHPADFPPPTPPFRSSQHKRHEPPRNRLRSRRHCRPLRLDEHPRPAPPHHHRHHAPHRRRLPHTHGRGPIRPRPSSMGQPLCSANQLRGPHHAGHVPAAAFPRG